MDKLDEAIKILSEHPELLSAALDLVKAQAQTPAAAPAEQKTGQ